MQDRRFRPGDVLDDYCPRERRITDHAIVAMIDDEIRRTRCGSCDAEHEYKEAKVPTRRKAQPPALFTQVLDGLQAPGGRLQSPQAAATAAATGTATDLAAEPPTASPPEPPPPPEMPPAFASEIPLTETDAPLEEDREEGPVRRPLIRAQFPKIDGATPTPRANPEFTIQTLNNRRNNGGQRHAAGGQGKFRRRRPAGGGMDNNVGPMRFRDPHAQGQNDGRANGGPQGQGGGRRRRGGKKNR
jgi:hypothetical protein